MHSARTPVLALILVLCSLSVMVESDGLIHSAEPKGTQVNAFNGLTPDQRKALDNLPPDSQLIGRASASGGRLGPSIWEWAANAGSSNRDYGNGIDVDSSDDVYVTGGFIGTANFGSTNLTSSGGSDGFIAKLNSSGSWQWAVGAGDSSPEIVVDSSDDVYVTGGFIGTANFGNTVLTSSGGYDIFIAKLNRSGSWQWAVRAGGSNLDVARGIAIDSSGNLYVTGGFLGSATFGSTNLTSRGTSSDTFIAKLNSSGSWQWAVNERGTEGAGEGAGIAVDSNGNVYVISGRMIEVIKLNSSGSLQWKLRGNIIADSSSDNRGYGIALDSSDNAYVSGYFQGTAAFGNTSLTSSGGSDIFIAKLNSSGSWQWVVNAGGLNHDEGRGMDVDSSGNIYVTGRFQDSATFGSTNLTSSGGSDGFIAKLNSSGSWQWTVNAGSSNHGHGYGIAVDSSDNAYVTGSFQGTATFGSTSLTSSGDSDIFIAKRVQDSDGDGWSDADEGSCGSDANSSSSAPTDTDSDGICDPVDTDDDGDGYSDSDENTTCGEGTDSLNASDTPTDTDGDGTCNTLDSDDDNDGVSDSLEQDCGSNPLDDNSTPHDTDQDSTCNALDADDDDDGFSDSLEQDCGSSPLDALSTPSDLDQDGICDIMEDTDGDGIGDINDNCDGHANADQVDSDNDGIGDACDFDADDDKDGVPNIDDNCPNTPEGTAVDYEFGDTYGCPVDSTSGTDDQSEENTTTTDQVMCPTDLCWDGTSRNPVDCSCPPETGSNTSTDQDNLGNEVAEPAFVPGFSMVTATIGLVLGAIIIATRRSEDSQTSHPSRPDNGS